MVLEAALLNTRHYKVRIKSKVVQSREWSNALTLHLGVVAIEKGAFGSTLSTMVANFTILFVIILIYYLPHDISNLVVQLCRKLVVVLFNPYLGLFKHKYLLE